MSRRNRGIYWAPRGSSFNNSSDSDDFPLAFVLAARRAPARKKKTPTKRGTPRRVTRQARRRAQVPVAVINLDSTAESITIIDSPVVANPHSEPPAANNDHVVKSKVGSRVSDFFKSGRFLSSDEEDTVDEPTRPSEATVTAEVCLTDDSDVEICAPRSLALPSTSTASEVQQPAAPPAPAEVDSPAIKQDHDSFMDYVDSVLNGTDSESKPSTDMKSFDDWSKETEEMLKGTSSLLNQLRGTTQQQEEQQKKTEEAKPPKAPEPEAPPVSSCPICYEPYSSVAAAATICGHIFCKQCITMACKTSKKCPTCRKALTLKKIHPIYFN